MKKVLTTIVAVMMISVMFVGCIGYDSDVDAAEEYHGLTPIHFTNDEYYIRQFTVNEGEYLGYKYVMKIYVSSDANTFDNGNLVLTAESLQGSERNEITPTLSKNVGNLRIDLIDLYPDIGTYTIKVYNPANDVAVHDLYIKVTMNVTIGSQEVVLSPIFYKLPITRGSTSSGELIFVQMDDFVVGKYGKEKIGFVAQPGLSSVDAYHWYATNLPKGLSMSEDGFVSGIPEIAGEYHVEIFASEHNDGDVKFGDLVVKVETAVNDPTSYDFRVSGGVSGTQINCFDYVAIEGQIVKIELLKDGSSYIMTDSMSIGDNTHVSTVKKDDNTYEYANVGFESGACILDTTGSGCYKVNVCYKGSTTTFHLYVIPAFNIVKAQIMISSS